MLGLLCFVSGIVGVVCLGRLIWVHGYRRGKVDAWDDITDEMRRYEPEGRGV